MNTTQTNRAGGDPLAAARAARRHYATPEGRAERLAEVEAEIDRIGAMVDEQRRHGLPVPHPLREKLSSLARKRLSLIGDAR